MESEVDIGFQDLNLSLIMLPNRFYIITKSMRALWLVSQLLVIVLVNPRKNRASSELLSKGNQPQVAMGYKLINYLRCW